MDGGSTDNSLEIIKKWEHSLSFWRSHPDHGQAAAINEGISKGTSPYVCWINSDDYFYPGGLTAILETLMASPEQQFSYGRCWTVSETGKKLAPYLTLPFSPWLFANFCLIAQPATLITRHAWEQIKGLNEDMQMAFDYDLWWRLYRTFGKPRFCKSFIAATRMHENTKTATRLEQHYKESIEVVSRNYGRVPIKWKAALPLMKVIRKSKK
jgi:glycosyltransferase involved in cell wall biosynthesis